MPPEGSDPQAPAEAPSVRMTIEARAWLDDAVRRIMAPHYLSEPERAGVHYELMSHIHSSAEAQARERGDDEVTVEHVRAAIDAAGGEAALASAFVAPLAKPQPRADLGRRLGAFIVDWLLVGLAASLASGLLLMALWPFALLFGGGHVAGPEPWDAWWWEWPWWGGVGVFSLTPILLIAYFTYLEGTSGQTLGKRVFGIRVVRADGGPMTYREGLIRNLVKPFGFLLLLDLVIMLLFFQEERQRASDRVAETLVVEA